MDLVEERMAMLQRRIRPLLDEAQLNPRIADLGRQIARDFEGKNPLVIGLLNGAFMFYSDLVRAMDVDLEVAFMRVASYEGMETTGTVKLLLDLDRSIRGRHVLVVEDIVDTGLTLARVLELLRDREPASLKVCTLLDKPSRRRIEVPLDYVGFSIEDHFVVGFGLDLEGQHRNLPYVGIYDPA